MDKIKKLKSILGKDLKEHVVLRDYTTMKVGGVADYFYIAKTVDDLIRAVLLARDLEIPYAVLGYGSNVLVSDYGFGGLVIINRTSNIAIMVDKAQIIVDSGVSLMRLIMEAANHSLAGLEYLYGIPGTVGGAVYNNAGSYGVKIGDLIKGLTLLSPSGKIIHYKGDWLEPSYRMTKLKKLKKQNRPVPIILSVKLQLHHSKKEGILDKIAFCKKSREQSQPYSQPSAGSIFKNPLPAKEMSEEKKKEFAAGYILDKIGAKGTRVGGAQVSKVHANFIINRGNAKAAEVRMLVDQLREKVKQEKGIILEEEVEYLGQW